MNFFVLTTWLRARLATDQRGAGLVEYAFLAMFIAVVAVLAVAFVGTRTSESFNQMGSSF